MGGEGGGREGEREKEGMEGEREREGGEGREGTKREGKKKYYSYSYNVTTQN